MLLPAPGWPTRISITRGARPGAFELALLRELLELPELLELLALLALLELP